MLHALHAPAAPTLLLWVQVLLAAGAKAGDAAAAAELPQLQIDLQQEPTLYCVQGRAHNQAGESRPQLETVFSHCSRIINNRKQPTVMLCLTPI
jgi:hypothetical protein